MQCSVLAASLVYPCPLQRPQGLPSIIVPMACGLLQPSGMGKRLMREISGISLTVKIWKRRSAPSLKLGAFKNVSFFYINFFIAPYAAMIILVGMLFCYNYLPAYRLQSVG